jgi:hypothetical protein
MKFSPSPEGNVLPGRNPHSEPQPSAGSRPFGRSTEFSPGRFAQIVEISTTQAQCGSTGKALWLPLIPAAYRIPRLSQANNPRLANRTLRE